ncbi:MAG: LytTR family DNA-binding domain-containing protein [Parvularculaceae bacterium]
MPSLRTILVDDEPLALRGLEHRLGAHADIDIVSRCRSGREAIKEIKARQPDLVFLDIQMPGLDGFAVVRALIGEASPSIIFVTAFDQYAIDAFQSNALDYLVKPVDEDRLTEALFRARDAIRQRSALEQHEKLTNLLNSLPDEDREKFEELIATDNEPAQDRYQSRLNFRDGGKLICLEADDIEWIDAAGDYMCIHAHGQTYIIRETMKSLQKRLDPSKFQRIHRSAIVNLTKVKELHPHSNGEYFLILKNGGELKLSRSYKDVVTRFL